MQETHLEHHQSNATHQTPWSKSGQSFHHNSYPIRIAISGTNGTCNI